MLHIFVLPAAGAIAADDDYIVTPHTTAAVQTLDSIDFDNILATPKVLSVKSVTVGQTGNVVITGTDQADKPLSESIAINDNGSQSGAKVFKTVNAIQLPAAVYQTGTAEVLTAAVTQAGNVTATVTAAVMGGAKTTGNIALLGTDTVEEVATKIAAAIDADAAIGVNFDCTSLMGRLLLMAWPAFAGR